MRVMRTTTTRWSRGSKCTVLSPSLATTSTTPPPWAQLRGTSAMLATDGTDGLTTLISRPTMWPARYTISNFHWWKPKISLRRTAPGQRAGQRVRTSPHAPTRPPWTTRTRSRPLGQRATPLTSRPRSLGSARTDGTWSKGLGTKQLAGRRLRTSACGIPTTPSCPQISSASSHIVTRCLMISQRKMLLNLLSVSQPTDEPNDSGSNYAFVWDNLRTPLDQDLVYPCKANMRVENTTEWKSEVRLWSGRFWYFVQASTGSVIRCGIEGEYLYPNPWPQCNSNISCGDPLPIPENDPRLTPTAPPGSRTWIVGAEGDDFYKAEVGLWSKLNKKLVYSTLSIY